MTRIQPSSDSSSAKQLDLGESTPQRLDVVALLGLARDQHLRPKPFEAFAVARATQLGQRDQTPSCTRLVALVPVELQEQIELGTTAVEAGQLELIAGTRDQALLVLVADLVAGAGPVMRTRIDGVSDNARERVEVGLVEAVQPGREALASVGVPSRGNLRLATATTANHSGSRSSAASISAPSSGLSSPRR